MTPCRGDLQRPPRRELAEHRGQVRTIVPGLGVRRGQRRGLRATAQYGAQSQQVGRAAQARIRHQGAARGGRRGQGDAVSLLRGGDHRRQSAADVAQAAVQREFSQAFRALQGGRF